MTGFCLTTVWHIPAPVEQVWDCLIHTESWPDWWRYVAQVQEHASGSKTGVDNKRRYCWRTALPYRLNLEMTLTRIEPCRAVAVSVAGDLRGTGECRLTAETAVTRVQFDWRVQTCKPWMNRFGPLIRPVFEWNHRQVMKQGEQDLIDHLSALKNNAIS